MKEYRIVKQLTLHGRSCDNDYFGSCQVLINESYTCGDSGCGISARGSVLQIWVDEMCIWDVLLLTCLYSSLRGGSQGHIDSAVNRLQQLATLDVRGEALSGTLPNTQHTNMLLLDVVFTSLSSFETTRFASSLHRLDVHGNNLSGSMPPSLPSSLQEM